MIASTVRRQRWLTLARYVALFMAVILVRVLVLPLKTVDVDVYLIPWVQHADATGWNYLKSPFTNYNYSAFYEHCLAIMSLFPGDPALRGKLFSVVFDFTLAVIVAALAPHKRIAAFYAALLLPTVIHNGALAGQSDAIYTTFILLALLAAIYERPVWTMIAFSTAFAIKFQSVMFMPVLGLLFLQGRQPLWTFVLIPLVYIVMGLPMWLAGRDAAQILLVYGGQYDTVDNLAVGAPNPWIIAKFLIDYQTGILIGLPLALAITGVTVLWLWYIGIAHNREGLLLASGLLLLLAPYVTPKMLDHFFYPAHPVLLALVFIRLSYWKPLVLAQFASIASYIPFLMFQYGRTHWLFGNHGYLQQHFEFGWGLFAAGATLPMGLAIFLLFCEASRLGREIGVRPAFLLPVSTRIRARASKSAP